MMADINILLKNYLNYLEIEKNRSVKTAASAWLARMETAKERGWPAKSILNSCLFKFIILQFRITAKLFL